MSVTRDQPAAATGTSLPIQPHFEGTVTARYSFKLAGMDAYVQGTALHQSSTRTFLTDAEYGLVGATPAFTTVDFAFGTAWGKTTLQLYIQNAFDERDN